MTFATPGFLYNLRGYGELGKQRLRSSIGQREAKWPIAKLEDEKESSHNAPVEAPSKRPLVAADGAHPVPLL